MLIAQLSDPHIRLPGQRAYRVVESDRFLPPALAHVARLQPRPDCLVITGDLTDFGRPAEYAHLRRMLDAGGLPYYLVPGNHDDRQALAEAFPDHVHLRQQLPFIQYAIETHPLRILALDTLIPGSGAGMLCEARLAWLARELAAQPERPTVVLMHHPPFASGIAHMDAQGLVQGADALEAILARHRNVERVLCGHQHRSIFRRFGGTVASVCPGPAHQVALDLSADGPSRFVMEPPGFHLHTWLDDALVTHAGVIGEYPGPYPFHEPDGRLIDE